MAGIAAAMATSHMTRCIRLPQTGCSEAWCERAALHLPKSCPCLAAQSFLCPPWNRHAHMHTLSLASLLWQLIGLAKVENQTQKHNHIICACVPGPDGPSLGAGGLGSLLPVHFLFLYVHNSSAERQRQNYKGFNEESRLTT